MKYRIGVYLRVSTDEQAQVVEGSLDSQKFRIQNFIEMKNSNDPGFGKIVETYVDDGYSAGATKRPMFQKLMLDLTKGKIDLVLVTDISRLSRSIRDFCEFLETLKKFDAKFLSIKDQFDTSTAVGEMMIFNMINLAQFERRQVSERVSQNFHARAQRGLRNGAAPILGYEVNPENKSTLTVNKEEATRLRQIFEIYLEEGSSGKTLKRLEELNIKPKINKNRPYRASNQGLWTRQTLLNLLSNKSYVGLREVNKKNKTRNQERLKPHEKYQVVKASWPAIVDQVTFDQAQTLIKEAHLAQSQRLSKKETRVFFASGVLKCAECGAPFFGAASHGKWQVHRYYQHQKLQAVPVTCQIKRIPADSLEEDIVRYVEFSLKQEGYLDGIEKGLEQVGLEKIENYLKRLEFLKAEESRLGQDIRKTFDLYRNFGKDVDGVDLVRKELATLSQEKKAIGEEVIELESFIDSRPSASEIRKRIEENAFEFRNLWKKSTGVQKKRLLRGLFQQILVFGEKVGVHFNELSKKDAEKVTMSNLVSLSERRPMSRASLGGEKMVVNASVVKIGRSDGPSVTPRN